MNPCAASRTVRTNTHRCQLNHDHHPPHQCVCGHQWHDEEGKT